MKYYIGLWVVLFLIIGQPGFGQSTVSDTTEEAESDWSFGVSSGFSNKYLWRGIVYNNGLVFQPEAYVAYRDLSFSVWSNTTLYDVDGVSANEIDYTIDYAHSFSVFELETFFSYYQYIQQAGTPNTAEWYLSGALSLGSFSIYSTVTVDVLEYAGASFLELGLNYEKELSDRLILSAGCLTGFGSKKFNLNYLEIEKNAFNNIGGSVGLAYSLTENFSLGANFYQNIYIDRDIIGVQGSSTNAAELKLSYEL
jgi:hypothetical protein